MAEIIEIHTKRLLLRQWRKGDWQEFARLNADPIVMEYYPKLKSLISKKGWGFWAVELIDKKSFIGFVGLHEPTYSLPVTPCVEIGWRLAKKYWGKGYAFEAAKVALGVGFNTLGLSEVYSFTTVSNQKPQAVMERLNMVNTNQNFEHPQIPPNSPLHEHVLYKMDRRRWLEIDIQQQFSIRQIHASTHFDSA